MNTDLLYRIYQDAYNEEMMPFLRMKNGTPLFVFETTDGMEGKIRKKFAELIIRECLEIIEQYRIIDDGTMPAPRVKIKNHFGVNDE